MPGNNVKTVTVRPTGTGSVAFSLDSSEYYSVQIYRTGSSATTEFVTSRFSNLSVGDVAGAYNDHPGSTQASPLTASAYGQYWFQDPTFSGTLFTASQPASVGFNLGNIGALHGAVDFGSKTGGTFIVSLNRKGS